MKNMSAVKFTPLARNDDDDEAVAVRERDTEAKMGADKNQESTAPQEQQDQEGSDDNDNVPLLRPSSPLEMDPHNNGSTAALEESPDNVILVEARAATRSLAQDLERLQQLQAEHDRLTQQQEPPDAAPANKAVPVVTAIVAQLLEPCSQWYVVELVFVSVLC